MKNVILQNICCSRYAPFMMAVISAVALGLALMSQYVFGLEPCVLCIYQRWPYGIVIFLGLLASMIQVVSDSSLVTELDEVEFGEERDRQDAVRNTGFMALIGVTFFVNSVIAFYHTGVELKWWPSHLEGCAVPKMEGSMEEVLANIQSRTKAVRCDDIAWSDPILNLSMANYNVIFCLGLTVLAFISARSIWRKG